MTQKQSAVAVVAVVAIVLASVFMYRQYASGPAATPMAEQTAKPAPTPRTIVPAKQPVPSDIDGITSEISGQVSADTAALDAEEQGELSDIDTDSGSVTDLSTVYDDNAF